MDYSLIGIWKRESPLGLKQSKMFYGKDEPKLSLKRYVEFRWERLKELTLQLSKTTIANKDFQSGQHDMLWYSSQGFQFQYMTLSCD